jgi:opacity protein-like surface antigen
MRVHGMLSMALLIAAASGSASVARAQTIMGGGYTLADFPMGDWGEVAGFGMGFDGSTLVHRQTSKPVSARTNFGVLYNFSRTQEVPSANLTPGSALELETKNTSIFFGIGPEFARIGDAASPFIFGTVGFQTYWSSSDLQGTAGGLPYHSSHGDSRISFAWTAGLGVRRALGAGKLGELSVEYRAGGDHKYVLPDEVTAVGPVVTAERKSRSSDQIVLRFGTVLGSY